MLSYRYVEDFLAERGIAVSYETGRRWVNLLRADDCSAPAEAPP
jgi:transposase-like protein